MSEENTENPTGKALVKEDPKGSLTIPPSRLAGSPACLNCGTKLAGPFCYYCGQPDKNLLRFFPALVRDLLADFMDFDSRFARTMKPLLFRPGKLTNDYLEGRRYRYTPPMRLYLFSSVLFFLLAAVFAFFSIPENTVTVTTENGAFTISSDAPSTFEIPDGMVEELSAEGLNPDEIEQRIQELFGEQNQALSEQEDDGVPWYEVPGNEIVILGPEPWHPENNPVDFPFFPGMLNQWINKELTSSREKAREIAQDPKVIVREVMELLPATIFLMLPLLALIIKLFYPFAKRFYVEHLIFALHNHAFIFVIFIILLVLETLESLLSYWGYSGQGVKTTVATLQIGMLVWMPLYMFVALKRVYRQGWILTPFKYFCIGVIYLSILGAFTGVVAAFGFLRV